MSCIKKKNYIFIKKCDIYKNKSIEAEKITKKETKLMNYMRRTIVVIDVNEI